MLLRHFLRYIICSQLDEDCKSCGREMRIVAQTGRQSLTKPGSEREHL